MKSEKHGAFDEKSFTLRVTSGGCAPNRLDEPVSCPAVKIMALATSASAFLIASISLESWTRERLRFTRTTAMASEGAANIEVKSREKPCHKLRAISLSLRVLITLTAIKNLSPAATV
eukprot:2776754-Amphidinium_carterae.1